MNYLYRVMYIDWCSLFFKREVLKRLSDEDLKSLTNGLTAIYTETQKMCEEEYDERKTKASGVHPADGETPLHVPE
jgi:hypothetical protein